MHNNQTDKRIISNIQDTAFASRDLHLDFLKAFCMLVIVFLHNNQLGSHGIISNLFMLIPAAGVPCFFMASGAVYIHRPIAIKKQIIRILRLYLQLCVWKIVYLLLYHYICGAPIPSSKSELFQYIFAFGSLGGVNTGIFWFIQAMIAVLLIAPVLSLLYNMIPKSVDSDGLCAPSSLIPNHTVLFVFVIAICIGFNQVLQDLGLLSRCLAGLFGKHALVLSSLVDVNPFSVSYSLYMLYFVLGAITFDYVQKKKSKHAPLLILVGLIGLFIVRTILTGSIEYNGSPLESMYYWSSTLVLSVGLFMSVYIIPIERSSILSTLASKIGNCTLGIFYLHIVVLDAVFGPVIKSLLPYQSWYINLVESIVIFVICWIVTFICKHIPLIRMLFS